MRSVKPAQAAGSRRERERPPRAARPGRSRAARASPCLAVSAPEAFSPTAASLPDARRPSPSPAAAPQPPPVTAPSRREAWTTRAGRQPRPRPRGAEGFRPARHVPAPAAASPDAGAATAHEGICGCPLTAWTAFLKRGVRNEPSAGQVPPGHSSCSRKPARAADARRGQTADSPATSRARVINGGRGRSHLYSCHGTPRGR